MKDTAHATDEANVSTEPTGVVEKKTYIVETEAGLFKNGKQLVRGSKVKLDALTAKNFLALGEIKEA